MFRIAKVQTFFEKQNKFFIFLLVKELFAIHDDNTLVALIHYLACEVIHHTFFICGLSLDSHNGCWYLVVVVAESNVRQRTPDVFFQAWIIDKWITIALNAVDSIVARCLLICTHWVVLRPLPSRVAKTPSLVSPEPPTP